MWMKAVFINTSLALYFSTASNQTLGLSDTQKGIVVMGSYLGSARFCAPYGVDFRSLADRIISGIQQKEFWRTDTDSHGNRLLFNIALKAGGRGEIYSSEADTFIDMPASGADMRQFCQIAHQQVVKISTMK
ncbi:MAG: hypothetical protein RLY86_3782 [Pseudomonadota bacterium]|jgi:hypothetical protein